MPHQGVLLANSYASIRPPPYDVAGRVVIADPDFSEGVPRHGATYVGRLAPHDLRIVTAYPATGIRVVIVVARLVGPGGHDILSLHATAADLKEILAVAVRTPVVEGARA